MAESSGGWGMLLVVFILLLCGAAFFGGMRFQQRRNGNAPHGSLEPSSGRLAVLESTPVDAGRRLILVRCDEAEHLIMVGGQADVVIDGDVRRGRPAGAQGKGAALGALQRNAGALGTAPKRADAPAATALVASLSSPPDASPGQAAPKVAESDAAAMITAPKPAPNPAAGSGLPAAPSRGGNGSGASASHAEGAADLQAVAPAPAAPRPTPRRPFFGSAFAGRRDKTAGDAVQEKPGNVGPEPRIGAEKPSDSRVAARAADAPIRPAAPPSRPALAAVPVVVTGEAGYPKVQPSSGNRTATAAAPAAARPTNLDPPSQRRDQDRKAGGEAVPGRSSQRTEPILEPRAHPPPGLPSAPNGAGEPPRAPAASGPAVAAPARTASAPAAESASNQQLGGKPNGLPVAGTPWEEGGGIEDEIERALMSDPQSPLSRDQTASARTGAKAARSETDPATTLGDLAERLESALAREIAATQQGPAKPVDRKPDHLDLNLDEFAFSNTPEQKAPQTPEQTEAQNAAGRPARVAPEPEARRERQDEAPVISLNSRRREPVDPLEDEMARLLGELTGDTNRR